MIASCTMPLSVFLPLSLSFSPFLPPYLLPPPLSSLPLRLFSLQHYHTLTMVNRDSFSLVLSCAEKMVMEKMYRLQETSRIQVSHNTNTSPTVVSSDMLCQVHRLLTCPSRAETACGSSEDSFYIFVVRCCG